MTHTNGIQHTGGVIMSDPYMPLTSVRSGTGFEAAKGVHGLDRANCECLFYSAAF